jgi:hypothetical protein
LRQNRFTIRIVVSVHTIKGTRDIRVKLFIVSWSLLSSKNDIVLMGADGHGSLGVSKLSYHDQFKCPQRKVRPKRCYLGQHNRHLHTHYRKKDSENMLIEFQFSMKKRGPLVEGIQKMYIYFSTISITMYFGSKNLWGQTHKQCAHTFAHPNYTLKPAILENKRYCT